jgi:hypothetical protein
MRRRHAAQVTTVLHHIFGGYECMQNACCECGRASRSFAPFAQLSVDLEQQPGAATLEGALARCVSALLLLPCVGFGYRVKVRHHMVCSCAPFMRLSVNLEEQPGAASVDGALARCVSALPLLPH